MSGSNRARRGFAALLLGLVALATAAPVFAADYTTGLRYDALHRLAGMIEPDPDDAGPLPFPAVRYSWSDDSQLAMIEKGILPSWQSESVAPSAWSGFAVQQQTAFSYDARGMQTEARVSSGGTVYSVTQFTYDADGRLSCTAVRMNLNLIPAPGSGACVPGTAGDFGPDRVTKNLYDVAGQLLQTRRGVATGSEQAYVTYTYTSNGDPQEVIDAGGNRAQFAYDDYGRKEQWRFPSATKPAAFNPATPATAVATAGAVNPADYEQWTYDANDNVTVDRKRDGREVVIDYDNLDRRQTRRYRTAGADEPTVNWAYYDYDLRGLQISAAFGSIGGPGVVTSFDNARRITRSTDTTGGPARALNYLYDPASNRIRITHPDTAYFTYDYDGLSRVTAIRENGTTALVTLGYDNKGDRASLTRANGAATTYGHDAIARLQSLTHDLAGIAQDLTIGFTGGYNPASQVVTRTRSNDLYAYLPSSVASQGYVPDGLNRYSSVAGTGFAYDANGNLTSEGASAFAYDVENRLLSAAGARTATLSYDPAGRLYKTQGASTGSATRLLYDGDALVAEYDAAGGLLRRYVHGSAVDEPLVWYEGSSVSAVSRRFLHADHQGTVIAVSDQGGGAVALNRFDQWGVAAAGNTSRFSYTGQIIIPELAAGGNAATAMLHYKARTYAPQWGRFLQTDPAAYDDQINLYVYVQNDPVNGSDPTGNETCTTDANGNRSCVPDNHTYRDILTVGGAAAGAVLGGIAGGAAGGTGGAVAGAACGPGAIVCSPAGAAAGGTAGAAAGAAGGAVAGGVVGGLIGNLIDKGIAMMSSSGDSGGNGGDLSGHAQDRMGQRGVTPDRVQEAQQIGRVKPGNTPETIVREVPSAASASGRGIRIVIDRSTGTVVTVIDKGTKFK